MAVDGKRRVFSLATAGIWVDLVVIALGISWPFHEYGFYAVERQIGNDELRRCVCAAAHYSFVGIPLTLGVIALIRLAPWAMAEDGRPCPRSGVISLVVVILMSPLNPFSYMIRQISIWDLNTRMMLHSADHGAFAQACAYVFVHADRFGRGLPSTDPRLPAAIRSIRTRHSPPTVSIGGNGVSLINGGGGHCGLFGFIFRRESDGSWALWCLPAGREAKLASGVELPPKEGPSGQSD